MSGNTATQKGAMTVDEKMLLVEKYHLIHENNAWYSDRENSHKHLIFKDVFFERTDVIGLLFPWQRSSISARILTTLSR